MDPKEKRQKRLIRHKRVRAVVKGTSQRPRLCVFRSNNHIYAQLIDDTKGVTLLSAGDIQDKISKNGKKDIAFRVGEVLAKKSLSKGISKIVFDRGGYKYHGRVKMLAEGLRSGGLKF